MSKHESEKVLEDKLIARLCEQGYEYIIIPDVITLKNNFRNQINILNKDKLNGKTLSDKEFNQLEILIESKTVYNCSGILRELQNIRMDDGRIEYISLFDKVTWSNNIFQVTNQVVVKRSRECRYDVNILINGLPLVQIELKKRGKDFMEAFNQIDRYKRDSFKGLFNFLQIFVISNGVDTKYFANDEERPHKSLTFYWTDKKNNRLTTIEDFTESFLQKDRLSNIISDYIIIKKAEKKLLVFRPYQIYAVESIIEKSKTDNKNGYIWHTTGSGKTLTSFKTSQLLAKEPSIKKVFFLVDRKDLDEQTISEFNLFENNSVDRTDVTSTLVNQLNDSSVKIIVTTIQKMNNAVTNKRHSAKMDKYKDEKVVFIIDECHRTQFGDMHLKINEHFKNAQYFGFTGTPLLAENKSQDGRTTADIFGNCLHSYLIKDAIKDGNVLGFSVSYYESIKLKLQDDTKVEDIDRQEILLADQRINNIANYIVDNHNKKTLNKQYNAIFATQSVEMLIKYYKAFKSINSDLKIGAIFSYEANEDCEGKDQSSRDFLDVIMKDYKAISNIDFGTNDYSTYFSDISKRFKNKEIDVLLVVNMFLTGFDSKILNTLYVDKKLSYHSLLQAFSRTNRVEKSSKQFGNIVCFQTSRKAVNDAVKLFSNSDSSDIVLMKELEYYESEFRKLIENLKSIAPNFEQVDKLESDESIIEFINAFRELTRVYVSIKTFVEFDFTAENYGMSSHDYDNYKSKYLKLFRELSSSKEKTSVIEYVNFDLELLHSERINVNYIIDLLKKIEPGSDSKNNVEKIKKMLSGASEPELVYKVDLINAFLIRVVPYLKEGESVEAALYNFSFDQRVSEIQSYANDNNADANILLDVIDEYQYSGVISDDLLNSAKIGKFLEKQTFVQSAKQFLPKLIQKYF